MVRFFLICAMMQGTGVLLLGLFQAGVPLAVVVGFAVALAAFGMLIAHEGTSVAHVTGTRYAGLHRRLHEAQHAERGPDMPELAALFGLARPATPPAGPAPAAEITPGTRAAA